MIDSDKLLQRIETLRLTYPEAEDALLELADAIVGFCSPRQLLETESCIGCSKLTYEPTVGGGCKFFCNDEPGIIRGWGGQPLTPVEQQKQPIAKTLDCKRDAKHPDDRVVKLEAVVRATEGYLSECEDVNYSKYWDEMHSTLTDLKQSGLWPEGE